MLKVKLKGDVKAVLDVISDIDKPLELEVFVVVNDQTVLLDVIQKCVASGVAIEIVPTKGKEPLAKSEKEHTHSKTEVASFSGSQHTASASEKGTEESLDIVRKYKEKKKISEEKPEEAVEAKEREEAKKEADEPKPTKTAEEKEVKKKEAVEPLKEAPKREEKSKEKKDLEKKIEEQIQEAEKELSFDEWLKLRDEAFSRTLIE